VAKSPLEIRLVVASEADSPGRFTARLESTGELIVASTRQPLVDGARVLLAQGFDPDTPLTMRHQGSAHDSFQPLPIGQWAGWTYEESGTKPLRRVRWMPFPTAAGRQKAGVEAPAGTGGHLEANSLLRLDAAALTTMQAKDRGAADGP
jgi:hypothetical protein